jgi:hypothetical protein
MTKPSPRIYTYKITFEEVPYYYYGVHKEKVFEEEYWGSPVTNKWAWELYTPKKQILEFFDYSDECWMKANEIEQSIIKRFYNTDKWCLNQACGRVLPLALLRQLGRENGLKNGPKSFELKKGIHSLSSGEKSKYAKISGTRNKENKIGVHSRTKEQMIQDGRKGGKVTGKKHKENKTGVCGRSKEKMTEDGKKGGKIVCSQVWECTVTGHRSNPGGLSTYQKARGIDTSNHIRIS